MTLNKWCLPVLAIFLLVSSFVIPGCAKEPVYLKGWIFTAAPVSGASVQVYSAAGKLLGKFANATSETGAFLVSVPGLTTDFTVKVSGGTHGGEPLDTELQAVIRNFDLQNDLVYINPVTTLSALYLEDNQGKTPSEADSAVRVMLGIPDFIDLGKGLRTTQDFFSFSSLLSEARQNGGLNEYLVKLAGDIGTGKTYSYEIDGVSGIYMDVGLWLLKQIASGIVSGAAAKGLNEALNALGLGGGPSAVEQEILDQLNEINQKLDTLTNMMENLTKQLTTAEYNIRVAELDPLINTIKSTWDRLQIVANLPLNEANKPYITAERIAIRDIINTQIMTQPSQIHDKMIGATTTTGLIELWSKVYIGERRFFRTADSEALRAQVDYFSYIQAMQMALITQYRTLIGAPATVMTAAVDDAIAKHGAELALLPPVVPDYAAIVTPSQYKDPNTPDFMVLLPDTTILNRTFYDVFPNLQNYLNNSNLNGALYGFKNWKFAHVVINDKRPYFQAMFGNPKNLSFMDFASSQGFTEIGLYKDLPSFLINFDIAGKDVTFTVNGSQNENFNTGFTSNSSKVAVFIVRDLAPGEWYFYK